MEKVLETVSIHAVRNATTPVAKNACSQWCAPAALQLWHLASLDAPTVAVVWTLAFAWVCRVRLPLWTLVALSLTVWAIYIGDRLFDAQRAISANQLSGMRERHFFHWRFRRILAPLAVCAAITAACVVFARMPAAIFARDSVVAAAALLYFRGVHLRSGGPREHGVLSRILSSIRTRFATRFPLKELLVGILFTAGCALPAWNRSQMPSLILALPVAIFAALAWLDCYAIDRWESESDRSRVAQLACLLCLVGTSIAFMVILHQPRIAALLVAAAASALLLALLDRMRNRITALTLRAAVDLALLTPLALLLR